MADMKHIGDTDIIKSNVTLFDSQLKQTRFEQALKMWAEENPQDHAVFNHSLFCQTYLPYRKPADDVTAWRHKQGDASLIVNCMQVADPKTDELVFLGLPYGTRARLILAYLDTIAIKTQSPIIDVEASITAFVKALGLQAKGRDIRDVKTQLAKIAASMITLNYRTEDKRSLNVNFSMVKRYDLWFPKDENQRVLWPNRIELSQDYFEELQKHAVPLDMRALRAMKNKPMALDLYRWLAQRLWRVKEGGQFISFDALKGQFGMNYADTPNGIKDFKREFKKALELVHLYYKDARFELVKGRKGQKAGIKLYGSPPPIPRKTVIFLPKQPDN